MRAGCLLAARPATALQCALPGICLHPLPDSPPASHLHPPSTPTPTPPLQIIAKVQSQGTAGLHIPPAEELPAGPFSCYAQYVDLMRACWSIESELRPTFSSIVQQLG